jgi:hypothetical protein
MSQSSPAYPTAAATVPAPGAGDTRPATPAGPRLPAGPRMALQNWRVSWRLIALIVVPTAMGLTFAGLQVTTAVRNAQTLGRVERLAVLGQQITGLAQAMEDERDDTASFIAHGRPASSLARLHNQYAITNRWADRVRPLIPQLGSGYPAQTQSDAGAVRTSIASLPKLRRDAARSDTTALTAISGLHHGHREPVRV